MEFNLNLMVYEILKRVDNTQLLFNIKLFKKQLGREMSLKEEEKFKKFILYLRHLTAAMEKEKENIQPLYPDLSISEDLSLSGFRKSEGEFKRYDIAGFEPADLLRLKVDDRFIEKYGECSALAQILYESVFYGFDEKFFPDREWYRYETFYDIHDEEGKITHLSPDLGKTE